MARVADRPGQVVDVPAAFDDPLLLQVTRSGATNRSSMKVP
jgi:hypothetical protein